MNTLQSKNKKGKDEYCITPLMDKRGVFVTWEQRICRINAELFCIKYRQCTELLRLHPIALHPNNHLVLYKIQNISEQSAEIMQKKCRTAKLPKGLIILCVLYIMHKNIRTFLYFVQTKYRTTVIFLSLISIIYKISTKEVMSHE